MENLVQKFRDGKQRKEVKRNVDHTEKSQHMSNTSSKGEKIMRQKQYSK